MAVMRSPRPIIPKAPNEVIGFWASLTLRYAWEVTFRSAKDTDVVAMLPAAYPTPYVRLSARVYVERP